MDARTQLLLANADGALLLEQHRAVPASSAFTRALRIADRAAIPASAEYRAVTQLGMAQSALLMGETDTALRHAYVALGESSARADVSQIVASLRVLATAYGASSRPALAIRTLRLAARLIEQVPTDELDAERRALYLATQHAVFAELTGLLLRTARSASDERAIWDAFAASEEGRARSIRYALEQSSAEHGAGAVSGAREYRALLRKIAEVARGNDGVDGSVMLEAMNRLELGQTAAPLPLDREGLLRQLRLTHATLVEYAAGTSDAVAFVVDPLHIRVVHLGDREALARAAAELGAELRAAEPLPQRVRAAAARLAELALWPLSGYLPGERIVFVPDDALHGVPFAILPWSRETGSGLLIQHAESSVAPSATLLRRWESGTPESPGEPPRFVLLGDAIFSASSWRRECASGGQPQSVAVGREAGSAPDWTQSLPSLPASRAEVLSVAALLRQARPTARVEVLLRCQATAAELRGQAEDAQLLHIATHGLVDARRPRLSALVLTRASASGGEAQFRLLDILQLKLRARLVVLSACDTSGGRLLPGEGVLGLTQAFLEAGAASVLASYWRVEDEATEPFMRRFYQYLLQDGLTAAAALRRAQLDAAAADTASFSWAAFSVYGRSDSTL